jgi:DNA-binding winged helix-turn-helix (wHTH) protein/predicted ATPase
MDQPLGERLTFGPFVLEYANARLLRDGRDIPLSPKAFDVLAYLAGRPDQLVSKNQLLASVWPDVVVSDASVKVCVREIRKALADDADSPRFVATVHRRGYRFVAPVNAAPERIADSEQIPHAPRLRDRQRVGPSSLLVGRQAELDGLRESFDCASSSGRRQIAFITGSPGTGKTALVDAFLDQLESDPVSGERPTIAVGHCIEQFGGGEPYLPFWEALGHLGKQVELPAALPVPEAARDAAAEDREVATEPRLPSGRLLRDLAAGIESLAAASPLVLVLEDLHWADYSTLDLVCALARRRGVARLLMVVTYRCGEAADRERLLGDLAQDLSPVCCKLGLTPLDQPAIEAYLAGRFPGRALPESLSRQLHAKTGGQPLFLARLVDELAERGALDGAGDAFPQQSDVPRSVKAFIDNQFERLTADEQRALEAAAVAGMDFSAATAAAALAGDVVAIEQTCDQLARRHRFLEPAGTADWPDGTLANRYRFIHELYHNAVVARIPAARRVSMHRALGSRLESAWAPRAGEDGPAAAAAAPELALHFERGRDFAKAVRYLRLCAEHATRQYAHREAIDYLRRALALLERLPAPDRAALELPLLKALVVHLQVTLGFSAPEVRTVQARAYELCGDATDPVATFPVLWGIWLFHKVRSELRRATMLADKLHAMAEQTGNEALLLQAYQAISVTSLCLGDPHRCCEQIGRAAAIYDSARHAGNAHVYGQDPCVATAAFGGVALWLTGREGAAVATSERAMQLARDLAQPSSIALALHFAAMLHQLRGDAPAVLGITDEQVRLSQEEGFSFWLAGGTILRGWATAVTGDVAEGVGLMRSGMEAWLATGSRTYHTYYLGLLADGLLQNGRSDEAIARIEEALAAAREMPEGIYEAELHRLKARCVLHAGGGACRDEAAESFGAAVKVAHAQGSTALRCRAQEEAARYGCLPRSSRQGRATAELTPGAAAHR